MGILYPIAALAVGAVVARWMHDREGWGKWEAAGYGGLAGLAWPLMILVGVIYLLAFAGRTTTEPSEVAK